MPTADQIYKMACEHDQFYACEVTVQDVRDALSDEDIPEDLALALDKAQAEVFDDHIPEVYVIIKIVKG